MVGYSSYRVAGQIDVRREGNWKLRQFFTFVFLIGFLCQDTSPSDASGDYVILEVNFTIQRCDNHNQATITSTLDSLDETESLWYILWLNMCRYSQTLPTALSQNTVASTFPRAPCPPT